MKIIKIESQHPKLISDLLENKKYSSTYIDYSCNVSGPKCDEYIDNDNIWKSDWKDGDDLKKGSSYDYDFHVCPSCQETNCMKCFDEEPLEESGRCPNKHCEAHNNCGECGEPYFQDMHGSAYCINPDCLKNNETKAKEAAALRLATKNYWIQCDGPNCDSDGWNPEYDNEPKGWHRTTNGYDGESSTDFCQDCWNHKICHECEQPYTDEEDKFDETDSKICHNPSCYMHEKCFCGSRVDKFGNCMDDKNYDASGNKKYLSGYCERGRYCRQCDTESRNNDHHACYNPSCVAYVEPKCDHEGCDKKPNIDYEGWGHYYDGGHDWQEERYHYCKEHRPLHCTEEKQPSYGYDRTNPGCGTLLNKNGRCPSCEPNVYDDVDWGTKQAHYSWEDDPNYPDDPIMFQHCDWPGCHETRCLDNPVIYDPLISVEDYKGYERSYCKDHHEDICPECKWSTDQYGRCNNEKCDEYYKCPECFAPTDKKGMCRYNDCYLSTTPREHCGSCEEKLHNDICVNPSCKNFTNPYKEVDWSK